MNTLYLVIFGGVSSDSGKVLLLINKRVNASNMTVEQRSRIIYSNIESPNPEHLFSK